MIAPSANRITQGQHLSSKAVDHSASPDPTVYAPEDGRITSYKWRGSGTNSAGNALRLSGKTGLHQFAHLEKSLVKVGQHVKQGQPIAIMGHTGYTIPSGSAGRHLHYWVKTPNGYVYPPNLYKGKPSKEEIMDTDAKVQSMYYLLRGRKATATEVRGWRGKTYREFAESPLTRKETDNRTSAVAGLKKDVGELGKRIDELEKKLASATESLSKAEDQQKQLTTQLNKKQAEIDALSDDKVRLGKAVTLLEKQNSKLKDEVDAKGGELAWYEHLRLAIKKALKIQ